MNQIKIGNFIAECRKKKNLTQMQLAEKLNITDRAISKWENGKSMPDLSLLKPICNILDISINELLSGEKIKNNTTLEDNIVSAINYDKKKNNIYEICFFLFILFFGMIMLVMSMSFFTTPISFTIWYSILGTYAFMILFSYLLKKILFNHKSEKFIVLLVGCFFISYLFYIGMVDYINVKKNNADPEAMVLSLNVTDKHTSYDMMLYDLYICNIGTRNEYRKIVFNLSHKYNIEKMDKYCKN